MLSVQSGIYFAYLFYIAFSIVLIILDDKQPQATMAWLLLIFFLPLVGLVLYVLIGRTRRSLISRRSATQRIAVQKLQRKVLPTLFNHQEDITNALRGASHERRKLIELLFTSSSSLLTSGNSVDVVFSGKKKFDLLLDDLADAEESIHMEYYIWRCDELGNALADLLIAKAKSGVEVRIMVDWIGSFYLPPKYLRKLKKAGIEFHRAHKGVAVMNYRSHRKIVVIDGKIGYTGGINVGDEYIDGGPRFDFWRDTHLRITGPSVSVLQAIFASSWYLTTDQKLTKNKYFAKTKATGDAFLQITTSGPDSDHASIEQLYFMMISSANHRVRIQTPYFIPSPAVMESLKAAALSGVEVDIMMTGRPDKYVPYWAAQTYFKPLIECGVRFYRYRKGFLHAKTVSIDSSISSIGTANMDVRSFHLNHELNVVCYDRRVADKLDAQFEKDLADCEQIKIEWVENQNLLVRLRNSVCKLFAPLL